MTKNRSNQGNTTLLNNLLLIQSAQDVTIHTLLWHTKSPGTASLSQKNHHRTCMAKNPTRATQPRQHSIVKHFLLIQSGQNVTMQMLLGHTKSPATVSLSPESVMQKWKRRLLSVYSIILVFPFSLTPAYGYCI